MADQLNWLNQHLLLLRYKTVSELKEKENYEVPDTAAEIAEKNDDLNAFLTELIRNERLTEACGCLAYAMHKRTAVWWGYNVLTQLAQEPPAAAPSLPEEEPEEPVSAASTEEAEANPENETMAAINAAFAKIKSLGDQAAGGTEVPEATLADAENMLRDTLSKIDEHLARQPQDVQDALQEVQTEMDNIYRQNTGMTQNEYWDLVAKMNVPDTGTDSTALEDSLEQGSEALHAENIAFEKEMAEQFAPVDPALLRRRTENAMKAVLAWCQAPNAANSLAALNAGNAIENEPAGTLAQAAFWSYGDLAIDGSADCVVKTPPGLAASGVGIAILQAVASPEGSLSPKDRARAYLETGMEIAQGKNNWSGNTPVNPPQPADFTPEPQDDTLNYEKWNG